jgi:hypothetical protein
MIARELPKEEWGNVEAARLLGAASPHEAGVFVVEVDGKVIAELTAVRLTHLDGLKIAPEYRGNPAVVRKLLRVATKGALRWFDGNVIAWADTPHVRDIIERLGGRPLAVESFVLPLMED